MDLNEDQFVLLYSFDTYFYDEATDFRFGNQSDIYAEIIDKATGNSVSGQVQLTSMIGNDDLVYFDIDDDNTISIAYTAIDYQYDGSWDRNEKTVFETYDSELARTSQFGPELASTGSSQSHLYWEDGKVIYIERDDTPNEWESFALYDFISGDTTWLTENYLKDDEQCGTFHS